MDLAYFPIQFRVIDIVSKIEKRGEYAYILNHEAGLYVGRFLGAGTFLVIAYTVSTEGALRYAIIIIAILQLASIWVAKNIIAQGKKLAPDDVEEVDAQILNIVAEDVV